ncbi:DUF998 domain-containing protein [Mucilaginibacter sp. dw_454]|uniref:DUF998 domain-containing protein n=1 Tax=Mucilaginibacter sp. dw_454 TaxID=2720079 RepID=UPI001BD4C018|nr:DUF998 domain-containing protein [Mucilaginibacter sp. dw_454]
MQEHITTASRLAALISGAAALLWMLLIVLLHFVKPQLNPAVSMCSEYARGKHGWIMQLAFLSMATGCIVFVFATWPYLHHFGSILLSIIGLSIAGAGIFVTDLVFTANENTTRSGNLHNIFAAIAILLFPVMVTVLSTDMLHTDIWSQAHSWIILLAILTWIGCFGFIGATVRTGRGQGGQNKRVPFGYYQRFMIFTLSCWLVSVTFAMGLY